VGLRLESCVLRARGCQVSGGTATNFVVNFIASFVETPKTELTESATEGPRSWGFCQLCHLLNCRLCRDFHGRSDKSYDKACDEGSFICEHRLRLRAKNVNRKVSTFSQDLTIV